MFFHGVTLEFLKFCAFYIILKALLQFINLESRRTGSTLLASVSGLFA
jgi:Na+-translocating ferredoxin:NAD+ oxidoreductase RnfA subunit